MPDKTRSSSPQQQLPGVEQIMQPKPQTDDPAYNGSNKLLNKIAVITGGDSGIGKAAAIAFAKEGADIAILYLNEHQDAEETMKTIEKYGRRCLLIAGDIGDESFCQQAVQKIINQYGNINILVNNAAEQHSHEKFEDITNEQLHRTFRTNIFSMFYLTKLALPYMKTGDAIINSTSVTAYRGSYHLIDYAATKGAIVSFTRSLASALVKREIRVNAVAPGPVWTPLIPATMPAEKLEQFGAKVPMERAAQPYEIAPCYVFLAARDSSYMTGQVLHPNGGEIIGS